jgi:signal transduction histidine kinase
VRRVPIRIKLAAALAVPLLGLFVVTAIELANISREVDEVRDQTQLVRSAVGPAGLITRLQAERSWPALELTGSEDLMDVEVEDYAESRRRTDEAVEEFRAEIENRGASAVAAYTPSLDGLTVLAQLRADIDADQGSPLHGETTNREFADSVYTRYTDLIRPFFDATDTVAVGIEDSRLRRGTELVNASSRQIEVFAALARANLVIGSGGGGVDTAEEVRQLVDLKVLWDANNAEFESAAEPFDAVIAKHFPSDMAADFGATVDRALLGETIDFYELMEPFSTPGAGGLGSFRVAMVEELNQAADEAYDEARARERLFVLLAATTLTAALALTGLVSRSITRPLRSLTRQARVMAEESLPAGVSEVLQTPFGEDVTMPQIEPVRVKTRDEVADVASALTTVQVTALDLAVEQAVLRRNLADSFVNLGRRNQNLLGRQIDFITRFEHSETDPDSLANLFRLDHLATRMRRNAESLLVLAGVEPSRRWMSPVPLTDVVRAALGEVEDYQRVAVRGVEPTTLLGAVAADLAHLLAELVENALVFSPADRVVDVYGQHRRDGSYSLAVIDAGAGMAPDALAASNRRLAGAESFTVAPSKYLGHYVAGRLAARHGIRVQLAPGPSGHGIVATVDLPPSLLVGHPPEPVPVGPSPARGSLPASATMSRPISGV